MQFHPVLEGKILKIGNAPFPDSYGVTSKVLISVMAEIRNTGMESSIDDWELHALLPDGRTIKSIDMYKIEKEKFWVGSKGVIYDEKDALYNKLPLVRGNKIVGILKFEFDGMPLEILRQQGTRFTLLFKDVRRKQYATPSIESTGTINEDLRIFPGTNPTIQDKPAQ